MSDSLGTRIMQLRGESETQQQLADALGVSRSLVKAWEINDRPVRSDDLIKIALHYGVSADYLLGLIGKNNSTNDEKLRMVTEFTGLSNDAVLALGKYVFLAEILSELLSRDDYCRMLSDLQRTVQPICYDCVMFADAMYGDSIDPESYSDLKKTYGDLQEAFDKARRELCGALFLKADEWLDIIQEMYGLNVLRLYRPEQMELPRRKNNGKHKADADA